MNNRSLYLRCFQNTENVYSRCRVNNVIRSIESKELPKTVHVKVIIGCYSISFFGIQTNKQTKSTLTLLVPLVLLRFRPIQFSINNTAPVGHCIWLIQDVQHHRIVDPLITIYYDVQLIFTPLPVSNEL